MIRNLLYVTIFISGLCSLGYQVIWQRYLAVLVGSEARSSTLVVATFLIGLAFGYYVFGIISPKIESRKSLLKFYGWIEMATGLYACLFPSIFNWIFSSQVAQTNNFLIHLILTFILIIPPTILMGATIPCMTAVLPDPKDDVNDTHSSIYGINTIGAFLGCLLAGLLIIPQLGLQLSLISLGIFNCLFAFIYIFNNLEGSIQEREKSLFVENTFSKKMLLVLAFVIGMITLATEVLWFRILGLAIGSSYIVFPIIVSIYILAIGFGSLTVKELNQKNFNKNLYLTLIFMTISFILSPYIGIIFANLRVIFKNFELAFFIYHVVVYVILLIVLAPGIFYSGRILPYIYALISKKPESFSQDVGFLYFINTLGTFFGAIFLGYVLLNYFQIELIYKTSLVILIISVFYFVYVAKKIKNQIAMILVAIIVVSYNYKRAFHDMALFRFTNPMSDVHFKNIFTTVDYFSKKQRVFFKDDPNTTVAVMENNKETKDYSVYVNGKSDGSTFGDFSTVALLGMLPVSLNHSKNQKHVIIGAGTGITAGVVATFTNVASVDLIEISSAIIEGTKKIADVNYDYLNNPKLRLHRMDAFQFFKGNKEKYDVVISEPSNPWVNGIENLYTVYFYEQVVQNLNQGGIFVQWAHTYSVDKTIIYTIISNLGKKFKNVRAFITSVGDIAFIASNSDESLNFKDVADDEFKQLLVRLGFNSCQELDLLEVLNQEEFNYLAQNHTDLHHDVFAPTLSVAAYRSFWLENNFRVQEWLDPFVARYFSGDQPIKINYVKRVLNTDCSDAKRTNAFCELVSKKYKPNLEILNSNTDNEQLLTAYSILRKDKFWKKDNNLLVKIMAKALRENKKDTFNEVVQEFIKDGEAIESIKVIKMALEKKMIDGAEYNKLKEIFEALKKPEINPR